MSIWISISIVFILGLLIYYIKPSFFWLFFLTIEPLILPIIAWLLKINSYGELHETRLRTLGTGSGMLLCVVFVIEFLKNRVNANISKPIVAYIMLVIYLLFFYITHNFDISLFIVDIRQCIIPLLALAVMQMNSNLIPPEKMAKTFFSVFLIYEFIWCLLNLKGIYIYSCQYISNTVFLNRDGDYLDLVSGTFQRFSDLSDFFTTLYLFICILFFYEAKFNKKIFFFFSLIVMSVVLMSGAKVSFILMLFLLLYCSIAKWQYHKTLALMLLGVGGGIVLWVLSFDTMNGALPDLPGLNRIVNELSNIGHSDKSESGTLSLTFYLLDNYFYRSPIIGTGLVSYYGESAYGLTTFFKTDARIAYILTEYGILGFILYISYYYMLFKHIVVKTGMRQTLYLSFFYFFLLTITQPGFFSYTSVILYMLLSYVFQQDNQKVKH